MSQEPAGLQSVEWEPCALERVPDAEIAQHVRSQIGFVPGHVDYFTPCPWLARQFVYWDEANMPLLHVEPALVQMIANVVAQDNSCRYCYAATRVMLRVLGFDDDTVRMLEQDLLTGDLPPATRVALDFTRRFSNARPLLDEGALEPLRSAGFVDGAILEIVYLAGLNVHANRVITLAAVPIDDIERLALRRWIGWLRPIAAVVLGSRRRRAQRAAAAAIQVRVAKGSGARSDGPFAPVVQAFAEHPLGARLQTQIEEAWSSTILPRRTKALIAAVVGRALGCRGSEAEARRLLAAEQVGFDIETVLAHLGSPGLSEAEAEIVPFVRETAHYSPAQVQRRGRRVFDCIGPAAFLEVVGVAALTNALCRMMAVLPQAHLAPQRSGSAGRPA